MAHLTVVLQSEQPELGRVAETADWPLHVTAIQAFMTEAAPQEIVHQVQEILRATAPLTVSGASIEHFGPSADIQVTVLDVPEELVDLHHRLVTHLSTGPGFAPDVPAYSGEGYRPHVTACNSGSLAVGEVMHLRWGAVVDMEGQPKFIAATPLGDSA